MALYKMKRSAARSILVNSADRIFLINSIDPADPDKEPWWEIPGGGIDPGESSHACAKRELLEEAGFEDIEVGPVLFTQYVEFTFGGIDFEQDEVIHVARTEASTINEPRGLEFLEALAFRGARWWTVDEIERSDAAFLPPQLPKIARRVVDGDYPDVPLDLADL